MKTSPFYSSFGFLLCLSSLFQLLALIYWLFSPEDMLFASKSSPLAFAWFSLLRILFVYFLPIWLYFRFSHSSDHEAAGGRHPGFLCLIFSLIAGVPLGLVFIASHNLIMRLFYAWSMRIPSSFYLLPVEGMPTSYRMLFIVFSLVLPIFIHELYFRGLLYARAPNLFHPRLRIIILSLLYALLLFDPLHIFFFFLLGLLLFELRQKTQSLLPPLFLHSGMILGLLFFSNILPMTPSGASRSVVELDQVAYYGSLIALAIGLLAFIGAYLQFRQVQRRQDDLYMSEISRIPLPKTGINERWAIVSAIMLIVAGWSLLTGI